MLYLYRWNRALVAMLILWSWELWGDSFVNVTNQLGRQINTPSQEWSPMLSTDGCTLVFSSNRSGNYDLYIATRPTAHGPFTEVMNMGFPVNTEKNEYRGVISPDGTELFFIRHVGDDIYSHIIYRATRENTGEPFSDPLPLSDDINGTYVNGGVTLSSDGYELLFHSNRPGGRGRNDIWVSKRSEPQAPFEAPIHFDTYFSKSTVCSPYDDWAPNLTADRLTLFLGDSQVSQRQGGQGKADIWVSRRQNLDEGFPEPVNLNEISRLPVNTSAHDLQPSLSLQWPLSGAELYFISNRDGTVGSWDIWQAMWTTDSFFLRGDTNADSALDIADAVFTLTYLFASGPKPTCLKTADSNDDGTIDIADAVYLLSYLFADGPDPAIPFGECGIDPTEDDLNCLSFPPCEG